MKRKRIRIKSEAYPRIQNGYPIELPPNLWEIIDAKRKQNPQLSRLDVLEWMIHEFSPSIEEELKEQKARRRNERYRYFTLNPKATPLQAWNAGINTGWLMFQLRKKSSIYKQKPQERI